MIRIKEILKFTPAIRNLIREDKLHQIYSQMQINQEKTKMVTMNQGLKKAYETGLIVHEAAISYSNNPEELIKDLENHINESKYFYDLRSLDRQEGFNQLSNIKKASRVIYLNKTCYNGLYRVNNSGEFNSPFGRYKNPNIVNEITIRAVSKYFNSNDIKFMNGDFEDSLKNLVRPK